MNHLSRSRRQQEIHKNASKGCMIISCNKLADCPHLAGSATTDGSLTTYDRNDVIAANSDRTARTHARADGTWLAQARVLGEAHDHQQEFEVRPGVSPDFRNKAQDWWQSVPENIRRTAADAGVRAILVERASRLYSGADKIPARGHAEGETIAMQPGFYWPRP